jgi:hypothetical protein
MVAKGTKASCLVANRSCNKYLVTDQRPVLNRLIQSSLDNVIFFLLLVIEKTVDS